MNRKKLFTTILSAAAVTVAANVRAQAPVCSDVRTARLRADTVVLSQQCDGPYTVRRILVRGNSPQTSQYDVRYAINRSDVRRDLYNNAEQLNDIAGYVDHRTGDTLRHIECIKVKGYASPDGSAVMNRSLAEARARKFAAYLDKMYGTSGLCNVTVDSEVLPWTSCRAAVASSSIPSRAAVLAIIDGNMSDAEKQARLKRMPEAWSYLARNVLPAMRRVDVEMDYDSDRLMMVRELTDPQPEVVIVNVTETVDGCCPACDDAQCCDNCCDECCDDDYDGIMIEYFGNPDEFNR